MNIDNLLGIFIDESRENLQVLNDKLLELEENPENTDILNEIFRVAHTFKGMAKTMGFNGISDLTHNMENLLELLRSGKKTACEKIVNILFQCLDKLDELVNSVVENGTEKENADVEELVESLQKEIENDSEEQSSTAALVTEFNDYELIIVNEAREKGYKPVEFSVFIENECVLPGVRSYMVNSLLEGEGEIFKTMPSVEEIEQGTFLTHGDNNHLVKFYVLTTNDLNIIKEKILSVSEIEKVEVQELNELAAKEESTSIEPVTKNEIVTKKEKPQEDKKDETKINSPVKTTSNIASQTIRVNANRLDNLVNLVGELVISKTRIHQLSKDIDNGELYAASNFMENITGNIQEIVMKLRMVPIEQVFSRFPRLVRDISKKLGKEINLVIEGKEIEIDRAIVDEIADPLVHLIRNSLDHGLEIAEDRIKAGKPAKGTLKLIALNECDNILIKVIDDGRGINTEKICKKAIEKGFIKEEEALSLNHAEKIDLLFKPGLSTSDTATDLSGRGVGMDVVRQKINSLNGTVNITSEAGAGTTTVITLPSTMAIIQSMLVKVGQEIYAVPLNYINEVIDIPASQIKYMQSKEVIFVRDKSIPITRLEKLLEVPDYQGDNSEMLTLILIKSQDKMVAATVSEIIGQQEIVIKNINKKLCSAEYISGATTLGNGQVALILNVNSLIK